MLRFVVFIGFVSLLSSSPTPCELCNFLLPIAQRFIHDDQPELIESFGIELCQDLHLADDVVCIGMIEEYSPVIIDVLRQSPLKTREICAVAFNCFSQSEIPSLKWNISIPHQTIVPSNLSWNSTSNYSIVHLADLHIDWKYRPGSNADCGRPLCCRDDDDNRTMGAEFWGDFRTCDIPRWTAEAILDYLVQTEKTIDWIYFTGDIAPHDVWQQTKTKDLEEISLTTELLRRKFPTQWIIQV